MNIVLFYHSLLSDWNHGNAHFLRGVATELLARGHSVRVYEPHDSWSAHNLMAEHGRAPIRRFHQAYPLLKSTRYRAKGFSVENALRGAELVLVHEWNDPQLVQAIGEHHRRSPNYALFFHDTHHRMVTAPESMSAYDLSGYDGVLAYGRVLQELYQRQGTVPQAWTWHEAADTRVFHPLTGALPTGDLVWIGNWGDEERTAELEEFLMRPCRNLRLNARVHGVRYPQTAQQALADAGLDYAGWVPNFEVPSVFCRFRLTVHVPRRPYVSALPGIPTIRPFEALACGIPLICSPWDDVEGLFTPGRDYLVARNGRQMQELIEELLGNERLRTALVNHGLQTIRRRHTCAHRVEELLSFVGQVQLERPASALALNTSSFNLRTPGRHRDDWPSCPATTASVP
jgi:spore maturation protein CgeB